MRGMQWSQAETARLVKSYYAYWIQSRPDGTVSREVNDQHWWAVERLQEAGLDGTLPMAVLDALLKAPGSDASWRSYVAAGPIEDLLKSHGESYGAPVAARCNADPLWAEAAAGVWLSRDQWEALPGTLQRLVPEPERQLSKARKTKKRPSKRQPRHP